MIADFFDINTVFFTFLGYQMSYLEFFGTVFTALCVWLANKNNVWSWPIGILGVILYGVLYYQIQLYSDVIEQIYYLITGFVGWYLWSPTKKGGEKEISTNSIQVNILWGFLIIIASYLMGRWFTTVHINMPVMFPVPASYPYIDAFTTVMSFLAQWFLAQRKIENWYLWILVDIIGVWLYFVKGVPFISLLYFAFLINAINALFRWQKERRGYEQGFEHV